MGEATQHFVTNRELPLPAVKLLLNQLPDLTYADKKFRTVDGFEFQRAWVQGHVSRVSPDESIFEVDDGTGQSIAVFCRDVAFDSLVGEYVLVVGKLGLKRASRKDDAGRSQEDEGAGGKAAPKRRKEWQLAGQKVKRLAGGARRAELWRREVEYLHQFVYHRIVDVATASM